MLLEPTLDRLTALQLHGMVTALRQWQAQPPREPLGPLDLVGLLADAEWLYRENRKLTARLKAAKLKLPACVEDIDYRHPRGLPKALVQDLSGSRWVAAHQTVVITGPTGVGKSYLACALAHKACRDGFAVAYRRVSRLYDELAQARADGTYLTALRRLAKVQLLVLDDFGLEPLGAAERKGLLEILEDRYNVTATLVTSQLDPDDWHRVIGDATVADAICDRLVHGAHRLRLKGESLRKPRGGLTTEEKSTK
jgi:DNA replication protein DnaC